MDHHRHSRADRGRSDPALEVMLDLLSGTGGLHLSFAQCLVFCNPPYSSSRDTARPPTPFGNSVAATTGARHRLLRGRTAPAALTRGR